ncbi:IF factor, partial [Rhinoptilus africanus]|nr:IF factor [Rhinoptilus africanus]
KREGMMGNIYSMGLALQALGSTAMFYAPREWDCAQAFSVVYGHDYRQPMAIAQVLPALVGKSYLDAARLECSASSGVSPRLQSPKLGPAGVRKADIQVHYSIVNSLQGKHFSKSISVWVPAGSALLKVLEAAEKE